MTADVAGSVLGNPFLTAGQLSELIAGAPRPSHLARLRRQGSLLGIKLPQRGYLYPAFQLDDEGRLNPVVVRVNRELSRAAGAAGAIEWWFSGSLGRRPIDLFERGCGTDDLLGLLPARRDR